MDTPAKISDLLEGAGFEGVHSWSHVFEHQWNAESFFALRSSQGACRRRLDTLGPGPRSECLARVRERLDHLAPADFLFTPEVIFAVGRKSAIEADAP